MYIGKSIDLDKRLSQHCNTAKSKKGHSNKKLGEWILSLLNKNLKPIISVLEVCNETNWEDKEIYWIEHFKSCGILNIQKGGIDIEFLQKFNYARNNTKTVRDEFLYFIDIKKISLLLTGDEKMITKKKCPKAYKDDLKNIENDIIDIINKYK